MKVKSILLILAALLFVGIGYLISSSSGKIGRTEVGCTCHGTLSEGNSSISVTANPDMFTNGYNPGETYSLSISLSGGPIGGGGFNLKASAGTFSNPGTNAQIISGEVTHSSPGSRAWTVDWIAPDASVESVTFNFAGNSVNLNGNTSGDDPTPLGALVAQKATTNVSVNLFQSIRSFKMFQNYPNPFNNSTQFQYQIQHPGTVTLKIFTLTGEEIFLRTVSHASAGIYRMQWNGLDAQGKPAPSGIYLYQLVFDGQSETKQLILLK